MKKSNISPITGKPKQRRGFACISINRRREIASLGGLKVSRNKQHMRELGRTGGINSAKAKKAFRRKFKAAMRKAA